MWARTKAEIKRLLRPIVRHARPRRVDLPLARWGLDRDERGHLRLRGVDLRALQGEHGSPLHVVDALRLARNAADFTSDPRCEVFYSYKTNPVPGVLASLHRAGVGAEVISPYELWLAGELGVAPDRVVFNGPAKTRPALRRAVEAGVLVNANGREELATLADIARALGKKARVGVRVALAGGWSGQFGEPAASALRAFQEALGRPELDVVCLHVHLGAEIATRASLRAFLDRVLSFWDELREELRFQPEIVDLGGSLACPTVGRLRALDLRLNRAFGCDLVPRSPDEVLSIREYVRIVASEIDEHTRARGVKRPRVFLEPGRAMTGDAQLLLCKVLSVREPQGGVA